MPSTLHLLEINNKKSKLSVIHPSTTQSKYSSDRLQTKRSSIVELIKLSAFSNNRSIEDSFGTRTLSKTESASDIKDKNILQSNLKGADIFMESSLEIQEDYRALE